MSCHVISCHVLSCHVLPCHIMSCHVMFCRVISCYVMSCVREGMFDTLLSGMTTSVLAREIFGLWQVAALESIMRRKMRCKNRWWGRHSVISSFFSHILIAQYVLLLGGGFMDYIFSWLAYRLTATTPASCCVCVVSNFLGLICIC